MSLRRQVVAVLGGAKADERCLDAARLVGRLAAGKGWVVLTGGGPGVMEAASQGACEAGGITVGVLPGDDSAPGYPNRWVQVALSTGLGHARNAVNVMSADLCVAIGGGAGTLSEVALALKAGTEVWTLWSWKLEPPSDQSPLPRVLSTLDELVAQLDERLDR